MNSIFLNRNDLDTIIKFMNAFPDSNTVEITCDNSSGIGSIIDANLHGVDLNGMKVTVSKNIVDESSWQELNMNLRELMIERILFSVTENELKEEFMVEEDELINLSDMDLFELYEDVMEFNSFQ